MSYMVRRIADKELFGVIHSSGLDLFDDVSKFADPYLYEYSASPFNKHTRTHGHPIMWKKYEFPSKVLM